MNYLEHKTQVKFVDGLLAQSQEWQWLIDEIQERFEIKEITSWEQYIAESVSIRNVFGYFVKILNVCDKDWIYSKEEFKEIWEIAKFYIGTGDDNLLSDEEKTDLEYRKAQLKRLQDEVVDIEDMTTGISIMDLGLNEFRLDLLDYIKLHPDIDKAPFGLSAVAPAGEDTPAGVIYVLKNRSNSVNIDNQNRLHPFYMVYITDVINDAINAGKQISFQYYDYTGLKKKVLKNKGEVYKLSPYKLFWNGDYYYVIGYSEKKNKVICFRVDRIAGTPEMLDKDIIPMPEDFDMENFTKEVFFMFSGEKVLVDLRCDNSLMKTMVDRFGEDVTTLAYDMTSFRIQTEVSASQTFFGWVFGFNGKVQILGPESVREQYRQMIAKAAKDTE